MDGAFLLHDDVSASLQGCSLQKPLGRFHRWNGCLTFKIGFFRLSHILITQLFYNINGLLWMEQESRDLGVMKAFPLSAWTLMPSFLHLWTQKALKHLFFLYKSKQILLVTGQKVNLYLLIPSPNSKATFLSWYQIWGTIKWKKSSLECRCW